jgi:PAS domain S-box-containing protein
MPTETVQAIVLIIAGVLLITGTVVLFVRKIMRQAAALERANTELAQAASAAEASRTRAEAEASQKARLAALLDAALASAPIGLGFFDRQLRFLRVNRTFAEMDGRAMEDHIGATIREIDPRLADEIDPQLRRVLATREPVKNVEFTAAAPGAAGLPGEQRHWLTSYYPIVTDVGDLFGVGIAVTDLTEVKRLEEQLVQAQKMEAVGRLAGGVAHDFNNLLTVINSYAELILFDPELSKGREEIEEIRGAAARAAKLTRQLLAFSRRQAMEPRIVNPNDVLRGVETLLRRLIDGNITVVADLSPDTPLIRVDPGQLEQVAMNLAINAADAMPDGGTLTLTTSSRTMPDDILRRNPDLRPGTYAVIELRDTGHGMDADTLAQIFEPFFTTKEPGRGTGLGLSTVYGIVMQSEGHVEVESALDQGTVFTVYLPAVDADEFGAG